MKLNLKIEEVQQPSRRQSLDVQSTALGAFLLLRL
jgi:hypothetical protein